MTRRQRSRFRAPAMLALATIVTLGLIGASVGVSIAKANALDSYSGCTVTEREDRAMAQLAKRAPRVYTDCGVFTVEDELLRLHFSSADVYNALTPGATVDLTTVGWRVPLLTWFPNVIEVVK